MLGVALLRADGQCRFGWKQRDRVCWQENESRVLVVDRSKDVSRFLHRDGVSVDVLCGDYLSLRMQPEIGVWGCKIDGRRCVRSALVFRSRQGVNVV